MKNILQGVAGTVMIIYTIYRAFTTIMILPLVTVPSSSSGIYFLLLALAAAGITALSFTRRKGVASVLALLLALVALSYWWLVICRASSPIWSDFYWFVVPETLPGVVFTFGQNDSRLEMMAVVVNALSILPASIVAFWHRRAAALWLAANAILVATASTTFTVRVDAVHVGVILAGVVTCVLALGVSLMEWRRWPGALERDLLR